MKSEQGAGTAKKRSEPVEALIDWSGQFGISEHS